MSPNPTFTHQCEATIAEKSRAEALVTAWAEKHSINKKLFNCMDLMLDELITNIVIHGFEERNESGRIQLKMEFDGEVLRATVRDNAHAFDPFSVAPADTTLTAEERGIGGLGVHFIRQMATAFRWCRDGDYNEVVIEKTLESLSKSLE